MDKIKKLTKSALLEITLNGWLYFVTLFPELLTAKRNERSCRNIINHFRGERNPSLSCYFKGDRWYLHDHADPDFSGDMFSIYQELNKVTDFKISMKGIYEETFDEEAPQIASESSSKVKMEKSELPEGVDYEVEEIDFENLEDEEKTFLESHNLSIEDFKVMNTVFLTSYTMRAQSGEIWKFYKQEDEVFIGHKFRESVKLYKPYAEEYKFLWLGEKPKDYVYGLPKLKELYDRLDPKRNNTTNKKIQVVLCAGEKDTLVANSLGFTAVCLNSETSTYFPENLSILLLDINDFCNKNLELIILYDNDETGKKQAVRIAEKQSKYYDNIRVVELPQVLAEKGGKDVSDWITLGLSKQELINSIKNDKSLSPISPISHSELNPLEESVEISNEEEVLNKETNYPSICEVSEELIEQFPETLKKALKPFDTRYQTMMTLAFITVFGSIFRNVTAKFRRDKIFANLYTVIIAPPASGKSLIKWARALIMPVERFLKSNSEKDLKDYKNRLDDYKKGEITREELGKKPPFKVQFIASDITSSMWVKTISDNDGHGIMYDTEIDGLVESNSGNLRSFNDYLRKAYEGEPIHLMRKTDDERVSVEEGKMSLLLSGTPKQFFKLIPDAENGLFSRVIPLKFNGVSEWQDAFELDEFDYENYFEELSYQVFEYFQELETLPESVSFKLTNEQLIALDNEFKARTERINEIAGVDARATVFRQGAITVKIAMILNTLRRLEGGQVHNQNECSQEDFESAMTISAIALEHVLQTLKMMNNERVENTYRGVRLDYFYALPQVFTYSESQQIAEDLKIKPRTAQNWLYKFRNDGFLLNSEKGKFRKIE